MCLIDLNNKANITVTGGTWSQISGPGSPDISDPLNVDFSTLPTGTYVFEYDPTSVLDCPNGNVSLSIFVETNIEPLEQTVCTTDALDLFTSLGVSASQYTITGVTNPIIAGSLAAGTYPITITKTVSDNGLSLAGCDSCISTFDLIVEDCNICIACNIGWTEAEGTDINNPYPILLTVGELESTTCSIDSYVIEWCNSNGDVALVTGSPDQIIGTDPGNTGNTIQVLHPLLGDQGYPLEVGTYTPKVVYLEVDGAVIDVENEPTLVADCLEDIHIDALRCSNSLNPGSNGGITWQHVINYNGVLDTNPAVQSFSFIKDTIDNYISFNVKGYSVADQILVKDSSGNILYDLTIGSDNTVSNYDYANSTIVHDNTGFYPYIVDVSNYPTGEEFIICVIPSVNNPNPNTEYDILMQCIPDIDCSICEKIFNDINTNELSCVFDTDNCEYHIDIKLNECIVNLINSNLRPLSYNYNISTVFQGNLYLNSIESLRLILAYSNTCTPSITDYEFISCRNLNGVLNVSKEDLGNNCYRVTLDYSDNIDYNYKKNLIEQAINDNPQGANGTPEYNNYIQIRLPRQPNNTLLCGDDGVLATFINIPANLSHFTFDSNSNDIIIDFCQLPENTLHDPDNCLICDTFMDTNTLPISPTTLSTSNYLIDFGVRNYNYTLVSNFETETIGRITTTIRGEILNICSDLKNNECYFLVDNPVIVSNQGFVSIYNSIEIKNFAVGINDTCSYDVYVNSDPCSATTDHLLFSVVNDVPTPINPY